jgi:hypothetical protein
MVVIGKLITTYLKGKIVLFSVSQFVEIVEMSFGENMQLLSNFRLVLRPKVSLLNV